MRSWHSITVLLVLLLFCFPLFLGLSRWDVGNDEAIYSYAVDRILETGEWLTPRSIPTDEPFLEKPPLKFWLVAAPIRVGLLPHDEFGLRFIDALCGAAAFVYVFLLGRWLAGPVCGAAAVLVLFTIDPLLFEHGLRSNNMEAPLFLSYCGGLFHFARWTERRGAPPSRDAIAVAAYFVLGFMTKFVAALFLPLVAIVALAWRADALSQLRERWRDWIVPTLLVLGLSLPWFLYEWWRFGREFVDIIFGAHVYQRFTSSVDPSHLQPWNFYYVTTWNTLLRAGSLWIVAIGGAALAVGAVVGRGPQAWLARLVLIWGVLPLALISIGTSKIFHYAYPYFPPLALAAGYVAAVCCRAVDDKVGTILAAWRPSSMRMLRRVLIGAGGFLCAMGVAVAVAGPLRWDIGSVRLLKTASIVPPILIGALLLAIAGAARWSLRMVMVLALIFVLPVAGYRATIAKALTFKRPLSSVRDCALGLQAAHAAAPAGVYNADGLHTIHAYFYYLRRLGPWAEAEHPQMDEVRRRLFVPGRETPVIMGRLDYELWTLKPAFTEMLRPAETGMSGVAPQDDILVLLPGAYRTCVPVAVRAGGRQVGDPS